MQLSSIVNVVVNRTSVSLSRQGFGNLALCACHSFWTDRVRKFDSNILTDLVDAGVPVTHPLYLMAAAARAQDPAPREFYVVRRTRLPTQIIEITPTAPSPGEVYSITVDGTVVTVTADSSPTVAEITAALTTPLAALADSTATDGTSKVTFTASTAGVLHTITSCSKNLHLADITANPGSGGIEGDLADAQNVDSRWYGLQIDSQSKAEVLAAAAWAESNGKLFVASSSDYACLDPNSTTDVAYSVKNSNYERTALIWHPAPSHYMGARWAGKQLPKAPGSTNWAHQQVTADAYVLTGTEIGALEAKNANFFVTTNGLSTTFWGTVGKGEYLDIIHGSDWMKARTQERYFALLVGLEKLPYTQKGIEAAGAELRAQFFEGVRAGLVDGDSPIVITVPTLAEIDAAEKAGRNLPGIKGQGRLAGAVNTLDPLTITMTL